MTALLPAAPDRANRRPLQGLLTATGASVTANAMVTVLVPWLVLTRTGSPAQEGWSRRWPSPRPCPRWWPADP